MKCKNSLVHTVRERERERETDRQTETETETETENKLLKMNLAKMH